MAHLPALLLFVAPALALADPAQEFLALDLNGDGLVSLAEAAGFANVVVRFDGADRNRDGRLTLYEFQHLKTMRIPLHEKAMVARSAVVGASGRR
ncbi:MAG TPA: hypothetical protein VFC18_17345 [Burkholderiales bacterium]|nr:hypothetical protein [Burkholderiales bacterium]